MKTTRVLAVGLRKTLHQQGHGRASILEEQLALHLRACGFTGFTRQYVIPGPGRNWHFDFAWQQYKVLVEVDGGTFIGGRHVRGVGYEDGCEKANTAQLWGWKVYRFTARMVKSGIAVATISEALKNAGSPHTLMEGDKLCEAVLQGTGTWYAAGKRLKASGTPRRRT